MKNIKGEYILYSNDNIIPYNNLYRERIKCVQGFTQEQLNERRKYEILKYSNNQSKLTKAQQFSKVVSRNRTSTRSCNIINANSYPPGSSDVPGKWNLIVNNSLLNTPLTNYNIKRQYTYGTNKFNDYFDSVIKNFDIPFKIISNLSLYIASNINTNFIVNELSVINNSNTGYSSLYADWLSNGSSNLFGRYYTTANNNIINNLDDIINDVRNNLSNHLNIKISTLDGSNKSLTGYIGVYLDKVYFISNENDQITTSNRTENDKFNNNTKISIKLVC